MTYFNTKFMTPHARDALLRWLQDEGLVPGEISAHRFSVHKGWISGYRFVDNVVRNNERVKVHFTQRQKNPLPEELIETKTAEDHRD